MSVNFERTTGAREPIHFRPGDRRYYAVTGVSSTGGSITLIGAHGVDVGERVRIGGEDYVIVGYDPGRRQATLAPLAKGTLGRLEGVGVSCRKKAQWKAEQQRHGRRR